MKKTLQNNSNSNLHPVLAIVKKNKTQVNVPLVVYILQKRKLGITYRQIQKDLIKDLNIDRSVQRICEISNSFKEAMQYV